MYTREEQQAAMAKVLEMMLHDCGGMGCFQNEEGIMIQHAELKPLAEMEAQRAIDVLFEHLWQLDWIDRVKQLRAKNS